MSKADGRIVSYERERMFAEKLSNVFLHQKRIQVNHSNLNIAFCNVNTKRIWFNFDEIFSNNLDNLFREVMTFKGLGFHEILHLRHTTRSRKAKRFKPEFMALLQRLEDGRIETLGVLEFEKLADYLIFAVNNVLLKDKKRIFNNVQDEIISAYILCYGRKIYFQDKDLLAKMREIVIKIYGNEVAEKIEDSIDKYIVEVKSKERIAIAQDLFDFLNKNKIKPDFQRGMQVGFIDVSRDDSKTMPKDLKEVLKDFPRVVEVSKEIADKLKEMTKEVKTQSDKRDKFEEKKVKEFDNLREKRKKLFNKMYDIQDKDKRDKVRKDIESVQGDLENVSKKSYSPQGVSKSHKQLDEMIEEKDNQQEDLVEDNKLDLEGDLKAMGHSLDEIYADSSFEVTPEMRELSKKLEKGLTKMNNELARGYVKKMKSGRVNIRRFLNRSTRADTRVFNRWLPDKLRQTKILVNLFVDGSGSMSGNRWIKAINSCWIINEALNRDKNKIMVYQFSTDYELVKKYDKPLTVPKMIGGGTYPASAIIDAIPRIEAYRRAKVYNYVVDIIITDGQFDSGNESDRQIEILNKKGHETILIHIGHERYYGNSKEEERDYYKHNAKHWMRLQTFDQLVPELTKIFTNIKRSLIKKAKVV